MATVKYYLLDRWGWECLKCKEWNEEDDDPAYEEILICLKCGESFEAEEG